MPKLTRIQVIQARARLSRDGKLITAHEAAELLETTAPVVLRYMMRGYGKIYLDGLVKRGTWYTSEAAVRRFRTALDGAQTFVPAR